MPGKEFVAFTRLDASDVNTYLVNNGYQLRQILYFTSNGTFTKADYPWLQAIRVRCQGGGGGGGGAGTTGASQQNIGGSGGGGVYAESFITDIAGLADSITVTRGAGGAGGAAGNNAGADGGASSFGSLVSANGGIAGRLGEALASSGVVVNSNNANATIGTGDLVIPGNSAENRVFLGTIAVTEAVPGSSFLGGSHKTGTTGDGAGGETGLLYGGGGGGGKNHQNQATTRTGGAGGNGIVIVELYA
jgi:hypothetical protein